MLTGWFRFGDSSTNIAASQRGDLEVIWPRLEVAGADGKWQLVDETVGFPTGNTKTIVCDLAGRLPADARRFRLTTSFEVRWDCFALYHAVPRDAVRVTEVSPAAAELQWHGFAELRPNSEDHPQLPNLARMHDVPPWSTTVEGWCTRYGDIEPLIDTTDERMAILNSGDGATIMFPAAGLPPREPGSERTLLLFDRGWIKEDDPNSLDDRQIAPFPGSDRADNGGSDWQLEYNTAGFRAIAFQIRRQVSEGSIVQRGPEPSGEAGLQIETIDRRTIGERDSRRIAELLWSGRNRGGLTRCGSPQCWARGGTMTVPRHNSYARWSSAPPTA